MFHRIYWGDARAPSDLADESVHLDNKTFVNAKLIRLGVCEPDGSQHRLSKRFEKIYEA